MLAEPNLCRPPFLSRPAGPYHHQVKMNYKMRFDHAASVWKSYSPSSPPDIVVVASALW